MLKSEDCFEVKIVISTYIEQQAEITSAHIERNYSCNASIPRDNVEKAKKAEK